MPKTYTPEEASRRLAGFAGKLQAVQRAAVEAAALEVTRSIRSEVGHAVGGDMRMSGVGRRGAKVGAFYNLLGHKNPTAMILARGPLHLVERDTKPHRIPKQRDRRARTRRVNIPGVGWRMSANHPGTRGKHPFERGAEKGVPRATRAFAAETFGAFRRTFG